MRNVLDKIVNFIKQIFSYISLVYKAPINFIKKKWNKYRVGERMYEFYKTKMKFLHKPAEIFSKIVNTPYVFIGPYAILFSLIIVIPVFLAAILSFSYFNMVQFPDFVGFKHYISLLTSDQVFTGNAIPNTIFYSIIVGPVGFMLSFMLAWLLGQVTKGFRVVYTIIIYSPSITGGVMMAVVWRVFFSGDQAGILNYQLLKYGLIDDPIQWLQDPKLLMPIMIVIGLWSSMGVGFLALLAGLLNVDKTLYEAAAIDGIKNRWQEIFYVTIPQMKPQMLFGAVMSIVGTFNISGIAAALSGGNPPPDYSGFMIVDHANDVGFTMYEMGRASAITVVLLLIVIGFNRVSYALFNEND